MSPEVLNSLNPLGRGYKSRADRPRLESIAEFFSKHDGSRKKKIVWTGTLTSRSPLNAHRARYWSSWSTVAAENQRQSTILGLDRGDLKWLPKNWPQRDRSLPA